MVDRVDERLLLPARSSGEVLVDPLVHLLAAEERLVELLFGFLGDLAGHVEFGVALLRPGDPLLGVKGRIALGPQQLQGTTLCEQVGPRVVLDQLHLRLGRRLQDEILGDLELLDCQARGAGLG